MRILLQQDIVLNSEDLEECKGMNGEEIIEFFETALNATFDVRAALFVSIQKIRHTTQWKADLR